MEVYVLAAGNHAIEGHLCKCRSILAVTMHARTLVEVFVLAVTDQGS